MNKFLALFLLSVFNTAFAADLNFGGTVSTSCSLSITQPGTLAISPADPTILSTLVNGGTPGVVGVSYIGTPTMTVTMPTSFSTSPTLAFTPLFAGSAVSNVLGAFSFSGGVASKVYASGNSDSVTIGLQATGGADAFPTGNYNAVVVVTCS